MMLTPLTMSACAFLAPADLPLLLLLGLMLLALVYAASVYWSII